MNNYDDFDDRPVRDTASKRPEELGKIAECTFVTLHYDEFMMQLDYFYVFHNMRIMKLHQA